METNNFSRKEKAVDFLNLVASGSVREGFAKYISAEFIHHNPFFQGDAESIMLAMEENAAQNPSKVFDVKLAIEEKEYVAVHSHVKQNAEDLGAAVVHIFRFEGDRVVELWDLGQAVPAESLNKNGMF
ncbi:nuclear transport factor 2 family protein [Bacillus tianshenii]|uniref:nuclear transport factor 2 family protein n=1 Tax=Sutcliffiella tianshenii TaxID=1463404 RepID=UPI001CD6AD64|nr:nuclear transport factor 2 family protein [Bacillus tianshenii]MCA1318654.1 nuclear transport factor 2 family protein [Bacillus tianshenii]